MALLADPQIWLAFLTLTALELVLGIDNVIFIAILVDKLAPARRNLARRLGLFLAMFLRIALLLLLSVLVGLTEPLFSIAALNRELSGRDLILIGGGLFLIWKSTREIHELMAGGHGPDAAGGRASFGAVLAQIIVIDIIFSLDSIITAVGMVDQIEVMVAAVVVSVALMMAFSGAIARFISPRPTIKMLALAFLFMIGLVLIADGLGHHIPKGYVYFAMAFSVLVEMLNGRMRRKKT
jgi:predicted tellurium resistance membrane protein TerC